MECAHVLRRAGASKVWVATVARTMKLASNFEDFQPEADGREDRFQSFKVSKLKPTTLKP